LSIVPVQGEQENRAFRVVPVFAVIPMQLITLAVDPEDTLPSKPIVPEVPPVPLFLMMQLLSLMSACSLDGTMLSRYA
jgi:hypothetical protein